MLEHSAEQMLEEGAGADSPARRSSWSACTVVDDDHGLERVERSLETVEVLACGRWGNACDQDEDVVGQADHAEVERADIHREAAWRIACSRRWGHREDQGVVQHYCFVLGGRQPSEHVGDPV